jgi:hypothetical protein
MQEAMKIGPRPHSKIAEDKVGTQQAIVRLGQQETAILSFWRTCQKKQFAHA